MSTTHPLLNQPGVLRYLAHLWDTAKFTHRSDVINFVVATTEAGQTTRARRALACSMLRNERGRVYTSRDCMRMSERVSRELGGQKQ
jgi:hypothetical protein